MKHKNSVLLALTMAAMLILWNPLTVTVTAADELPSGPLIVRQLAERDAWKIVTSQQVVAAKPAGRYSTPRPAPEVSESPQRQQQVSSNNDFLKIINFGRPVEMRLVRVRERWSAVLVNQQGETIEQWRDTDGQTYWLAGLRKMEQTIGAEELAETGLIDYTHNPFPGTGFASRNTYRGIEKIDGVTCWVFKIEETTLWVNQSTRYPRRMQRGLEITDYLAQDVPNTLPLPDVIIKTQEAVSQHLKFLRRPIPKGG